jgi:hypothetical protein
MGVYVFEKVPSYKEEIHIRYERSHNKKRENIYLNVEILEEDLGVDPKDKKED